MSVFSTGGLLWLASRLGDHSNTLTDLPGRSIRRPGLALPVVLTVMVLPNARGTAQVGVAAPRGPKTDIDDRPMVMETSQAHAARVAAKRSGLVTYTV